MKRNFNEEYKNYVNNDMPDLWSRIEPALKEKSIGKITEKAGNTTSENEEGKELDEEIKAINLQPRKRKNSWMKYASVAAGVLLCIVGIRIYQNAGIESSDESTNKMELTADCTTADEISADDCIEESTEEECASESAAKDYNMEDSAASDEGEMAESAPMDRQEMTASDEESQDTASESAESEAKEDVADSDTEDNTAGQDSHQVVTGTEQADFMTDSGTSTEDMEEMELYALSEDGFLIDTEEMESQTIKKEKVEHAYIDSSDKAPSKWQKRGYVTKYTFIASGRNYVVYVTEEQKKRLEQKLYDPSYVGAYTLYLSIQKEGEKESEGVFSEKETVRE